MNAIPKPASNISNMIPPKTNPIIPKPAQEVTPSPVINNRTTPNIYPNPTNSYSAPTITPTPISTPTKTPTTDPKPMIRFTLPTSDDATKANTLLNAATTTKPKVCFLCKQNHWGSDKGTIVCPNKDRPDIAIMIAAYEARKIAQKQIRQLKASDVNVNEESTLPEVEIKLLNTSLSSECSSGLWLRLNGDMTYCQVDTGSEVSCYDYDTFKNKYPEAEVISSDLVLRDVSKKLVHCYGRSLVVVSEASLMNGEDTPCVPSSFYVYLVKLDIPIIGGVDASSNGLDILKSLQLIYDSNKGISVKSTIKAISSISIPDHHYIL
jgi:hypothetical protein